MKEHIFVFFVVSAVSCMTGKVEHPGSQASWHPGRAKYSDALQTF